LAARLPKIPVLWNPEISWNICSWYPRILNPG
jgi:hypothetical protein